MAFFHLYMKVPREQTGRQLREKNAPTFAKVGLETFWSITDCPWPGANAAT